MGVEEEAGVQRAFDPPTGGTAAQSLSRDGQQVAAGEKDVEAQASVPAPDSAAAKDASSGDEEPNGTSTAPNVFIYDDASASPEREGSKLPEDPGIGYPVEPHPLGKIRPRPSLDDLHSSLPAPAPSAGWGRKLLAFFGVASVVAVGYMDPGNWAAALEAGSKFGYLLLSVVVLSSLLSLFLQHLALKLGAATDLDLAQACHASLSPGPNYVLWVLTELAIAATDLVGVLGSATALHLLLGVPMWAAILITSLDILVLLAVLGRSMRVLELVVLLLCFFILGSFIYELVLAKPDWALVLWGFVPRGAIFQGALYNAVAIVGANIMPHNLYLHSSLIQTRDYPRNTEGRRMAIRYGTLDSNFNILLATLVMCTILIVSAAAFYYGTHQQVVTLAEAYSLISPVLGQDTARILFAVALLAAGQSSSVAGTLSGQIVMEGFVEMKLSPWFRRLVTRLITILPAMVAALIGGTVTASSLLVLCQVVLSLQLPFAMGPLVYFTSSRELMGDFANNRITQLAAWAAFGLITGLNLYLVGAGIVHLAS